MTARDPLRTFKQLPHTRRIPRPDAIPALVLPIHTALLALLLWKIHGSTIAEELLLTIARAKASTRLLRSVQLRTVGETPVLFMPPAPLRTSGPPLAWPLWTTKPSSVAFPSPMITGYAGGPAQRALARSIMAMFVWYRASDHWVSQPANPPYNDTSVFIKSEPVALAGQTSLFYRRVS